MCPRLVQLATLRARNVQLTVTTIHIKNVVQSPHGQLCCPAFVPLSYVAGFLNPNREFLDQSDTVMYAIFVVSKNRRTSDERFVSFRGKHRTEIIERVLQLIAYNFDRTRPLRRFRTARRLSTRPPGRKGTLCQFYFTHDTRIAKPSSLPFIFFRYHDLRYSVAKKKKKSWETSRSPIRGFVIRYIWKSTFCHQHSRKILSLEFHPRVDNSSIHIFAFLTSILNLLKFKCATCSAYSVVKTANRKIYRNSVRTVWINFHNFLYFKDLDNTRFKH